MNADIVWPSAFILGGALNFLFQYLLLHFESRAAADFAGRLAQVRENFAARNPWALLLCVVGGLWLAQEFFF